MLRIIRKQWVYTLATYTPGIPPISPPTYENLLCWCTPPGIHALPNKPSQLTHRKRWQPLMESPDNLGYIVTQEHVTPHIGVTARFYGFDSAADEHNFASRKLSTPEYRSR